MDITSDDIFCDTEVDAELSYANFYLDKPRPVEMGICEWLRREGKY